MPAKISVVIPSYQGRELLRNNLPSVFRALENSGLRHEVVVADDASTDGTIDFLKIDYPQIITVQNSINLGFSGNINEGLKKATGNLVLALNTDVSLDPDYFKFQLDYFMSEDTFGVMGALCDPKTGALQDAAKKCELAWWGKLNSTKNLLPLDGTSLVTLFLSGANSLVDRKKLDQIGYFDELFSPFYNEDVELGIRAWRMGWRCYFEPRARAFHAISETINRTSSQQKIRQISLRNRFYLHSIHLSGTKRILFFICSWLSLTVRWTRGDFAFYRAFLEFLQTKKTVMASQERFLRLRPQLKLDQVYDLIQREQGKKKCRVF